jgi:predicted O-methyltransferase YrrM
MVITEENIEFIRKILPKFKGRLHEVQMAAVEEGIPIIPHETARFLSLLMGIIKPVNILEIGTAVGFSAALFCEFTDARLTTIDRYEYMIKKAKENFAYLGIEDRVTLLEGDAAVILPSLSDEYDFIFLDAAKAQYINYLPDIMRLLKPGSILAVDDVLKPVMILRCDTPKRQRTTHKRLGEFLCEITTRDDLETALIPVGGGLAVCRKK